MATDEEFDELLRKSSLGTSAARLLKARTPPSQRSIVSRLADLTYQIEYGTPEAARAALAQRIDLLTELEYAGVDATFDAAIDRRARVDDPDWPVVRGVLRGVPAVEFQPIGCFAMATPSGRRAYLRFGGIAWAEAVLQWPDDLASMSEPSNLVPILQRYGVVAPFLEHLFAEVLRAIGKWGAAGRSTQVVLPVAPQLINDPGFATTLSRELQRNQIAVPYMALIMTIAEEQLTEVGFDRLRELSRLGVELAVHNFRGAAPTRELVGLPLHHVMLDESITSNLDDENCRETVRELGEMGRRLGLQVVARGVDTLTQSTQLYDLGYTLGQGRHFAGPGSADELLRLLQTPLDFRGVPHRGWVAGQYFPSDDQFAELGPFMHVGTRTPFGDDAATVVFGRSQDERNDVKHDLERLADRLQPRDAADLRWLAQHVDDPQEPAEALSHVKALRDKEWLWSRILAITQGATPVTSWLSTLIQHVARLP